MIFRCRQLGGHNGLAEACIVFQNFYHFSLDKRAGEGGLLVRLLGWTNIDYCAAFGNRVSCIVHHTREAPQGRHYLH